MAKHIVGLYEITKEFERDNNTEECYHGQMLFLMTAISKMKDIDKGGSRIAIIHNGSPLFTGDAGSGPSEIRRYILENDLLEAIIALPNDIFYNTVY